MSEGWPAASEVYATLALAGDGRLSAAHIDQLGSLLVSLATSRTTRPVVVLTDATNGSLAHMQLKGVTSCLNAYVVHVPTIPLQRCTKFRRKTCITPSTFTKMRVFDAPVQRLLFMDMDTIVQKNIDVLFGMPLRARSLAAAPDQGRGCDFHQGARSAEWTRACKARHGQTFNSGVMLVQPSRQMFEAMMRERARGHHGGSGDHTDQGFLNGFFHGFTPLNLSFNTFALDEATGRDRDPELAHVLHFAGPLKPDTSGSRTARSRFPKSAAAYERFAALFRDRCGSAIASRDRR